MRIYYRDNQICVTSAAIWVGGDEYPFDELDGVWCKGGSLAGRALLIGLAGVVISGGYRAAASYAWWFGGLWRHVRRWATAGVVTVALLAGGVMLVTLAGLLSFVGLLLGVEHARGHGRYRELWASVRGEDVLLLRTSDAARFERVRRALARALGNRPGDRSGEQPRRPS